MTIFPLPRVKINVFVTKVGPGSSQNFFVILDKSICIIKLLKVVSSILLETILFPVNQILNDLFFSFLDLMLVENLFCLKTPQLISIIFHKYGR